MWFSFFNIDSSNGEISLNKPLDYEKVKHVTLTIQASDGAKPFNKNSTTVNIIVIDKNDEKPTFEKENYTSILKEDIKIG